MLKMGFMLWEERETRLCYERALAVKATVEGNEVLAMVTRHGLCRIVHK